MKRPVFSTVSSSMLSRMPFVAWLTGLAPKDSIFSTLPAKRSGAAVRGLNKLLKVKQSRWAGTPRGVDFSLAAPMILSVVCVHVAE